MAATCLRSRRNPTAATLAMAGSHHTILVARVLLCDSERPLLYCKISAGVARGRGGARGRDGARGSDFGQWQYRVEVRFWWALRAGWVHSNDSARPFCDGVLRECGANADRGANLDAWPQAINDVRQQTVRGECDTVCAA